MVENVQRTRTESDNVSVTESGQKTQSYSLLFLQMLSLVNLSMYPRSDSSEQNLTLGSAKIRTVVFPTVGKR